MRQRASDSNKDRRRLASVAAILVFLTLGFCPLRNTLARLALPAPPTRGQQVPEFAKVIAPDICGFAVVSKAAPNTGRLLYPSLDTTINSTYVCCKPQQTEILFSNLLPQSPGFTAACPIYLRNRVLLI